MDLANTPSPTVHLTQALYTTLTLLIRAQSRVNLAMARSLEGEHTSSQSALNREELDLLERALREAYYSVKQTKPSFEVMRDELSRITASSVTGHVSLSASNLAWLPAHLREPPWHLELMRALSLGEILAWQKARETERDQAQETLLKMLDDIKKVFSRQPPERRAVLWPTDPEKRSKGLSLRLLALDEQLRSLARATHLAMLVFERWPLVRQ